MIFGPIANLAAEAVFEEMIDETGRKRPPSVEEMKLQLDDLIQQGQITPEEAQVYLQEASKMNEINQDPRFQQAQMDALLGLQDISVNKGLTDMDQAQLAKIKSQEDQQQRGAREAILQNAQARGMGGSGIELMSQMQNQQDSATRQSQRDLDVAAMAQERALQALQQAGNLGGQMQTQDFARQSDIARANDAINQFNTQNKQQIGTTNTQARNAAQIANLAEKQRIADANITNKNAQQEYNKSLLQNNFNNEMGLLGMKQKAQTSLADAKRKTGESMDNSFKGLATAGSFSDKNLKEDIKQFDPSEFLDSLTSYKYRYKDPKHGQGQNVGIMAQDLEKTEEGRKLVENTPEGKLVDYSKAGGTIFASLADIHDRLKELEDK